jgi:hypothetical protein
MNSSALIIVLIALYIDIPLKIVAYALSTTSAIVLNSLLVSNLSAKLKLNLYDVCNFLISLPLSISVTKLSRTLKLVDLLV